VSDSEIRRLERLVDAGDPAALEQLVRELERRGVFEDILARLRVQLTAAGQHPRAHLLGELTVFHIAEGVRELLRPDRAPTEPPWQLALRREFLSQQRSHMFQVELAYAAIALDAGNVRIAPGRCEPVALAAFDRELGARRHEVTSIFAVSEHATFATPPAEHVTLSRAAALAWTLWCANDPRTQARDIQIDHVRLRPAMYIGSTTANGLYQLAEECLLDVIAEFLSGGVSEATVALRADGSLEVYDDGPGIPVNARDSHGPSPLVSCFTSLESRGRSREERAFGSHYPGMMGVGTACVNFLSTWFEVETARDGELWCQRFEQGQPSRPLASLGKTDRRGTRVRFLPDPTIFSAVSFAFDRISARMEELSFLFPRLQLKLVEEGGTHAVVHRSERGLPDLITKITANERRIVEPVFTVTGALELRPSGETIHVEAALAWTHGDSERVLSFVNGGPTTDGGTHVAGLFEALGAALQDPAAREPLRKSGSRPPAVDEVRIGLRAAVAVRMPEAQFQGSTHSRLGSEDVRPVVSQIVGPALTSFLRQQPRLVKALALRAGRARAAGP
jgi:hypothetical protein